jgi:hypothetical protein
MKYLLFTVFLGLFSAAGAQVRGCGKFKDGKYKLTSEHSGTSIIERKGSRQTERIVGKKGKSTFIVKWTDECTYTLTPTRWTRRKFREFPKDSYLIVKIIEVKENSYVQKCKFNFLDFELTDEMVRID